MKNASFVFDATAENFASEVVQTSFRLPLLVDFWAPWCGPCRTLMPLLTRLADEYAGLFLLAKANIDEQQSLAMQFGVRSVPTVKLFRNGEVVEEFLGAQPEAVIRQMLDRHVERESDRLIASALEISRAGRGGEARRMVESARAKEPENPKLTLALAELALAADDFAACRNLLESLPRDLREEPTTRRLLHRLEFGEIAAGAPQTRDLLARIAANPRDSEARYQLAAKRVLGEDYEGAMEQLLELLRRDRAYGDDAGRAGLLKVFELLGGGGDLVNRYRSLLFNALH